MHTKHPDPVTNPWGDDTPKDAEVKRSGKRSSVKIRFTLATSQLVVSVAVRAMARQAPRFEQVQQGACLIAVVLANALGARETKQGLLKSLSYMGFQPDPSAYPRLLRASIVL